MRIAFAWEVKCHTRIYRDTKPLHWHWQHRRRRSLDSVAVITGKCVLLLFVMANHFRIKVYSAVFPFSLRFIDYIEMAQFYSWITMTCPLFRMAHANTIANPRNCIQPKSILTIVLFTHFQFYLFIFYAHFRSVSRCSQPSVAHNLSLLRMPHLPFTLAVIVNRKRTDLFENEQIFGFNSPLKKRVYPVTCTCRFLNTFASIAPYVWRFRFTQRTSVEPSDRIHCNYANQLKRLMHNNETGLVLSSSSQWLYSPCSYSGFLYAIHTTQLFTHDDFEPKVWQAYPTNTPFIAIQSKCDWIYWNGSFMILIFFWNAHQNSFNWS